MIGRREGDERKMFSDAYMFLHNLILSGSNRMLSRMAVGHKRLYTSLFAGGQGVPEAKTHQCDSRKHHYCHGSKGKRVISGEACPRRMHVIHRISPPHTHTLCFPDVQKARPGIIAPALDLVKLTGTKR